MLRPALALLLALAAGPAPAQTVEVDLELALLVDVSRSMSEAELEIQRRGYVAALQSDAVFAAIQTGLLQRIAISYIEWAGTQQVIVPWRLIETREDLDDFAEELAFHFNPSLRRTSISEALVFGAREMRTNAYDGLRRVIDISGDGPNNQGRVVTDARDAVLSEGIVINGLPLMTRDEQGAAWYLEDLDLYYQTCVTGGPGSFVIPVYDWKDFAEAVRRKLVLEIAAVTPEAPLERLEPASARDASDCLIGEKIWQERQRYWGEP